MASREGAREPLSISFNHRRFSLPPVCRQVFSVSARFHHAVGQVGQVVKHVAVAEVNLDKRGSDCVVMLASFDKEVNQHLVGQTYVSVDVHVVVKVAALFGDQVYQVCSHRCALS